MHPILIAGAAVVGLPILLHLLLRQQPKRLVFPALRFLKQRQKTSQRRVQLRHILLMALRCLLLALFALALYQPTISTAGGLNLSGEEPIAVVVVIDTSPSMGYRDGTTRLDEARRRANDLLNELPRNSKVAVLPSHDPSGTWQPTLLEARQRIDALTEPTGSAQSLGPALRAAYDLLATADADSPDGADPLPRLIAVFGDRTLASWDARETSGLTAKRDAVPQPLPVQVFFDVGVEKPANLAVTGLAMETDRLSGAADAVLTAMVRADGLDVSELEVKAQLDDGPPQTVVVNVAAGTTVPATFTFRQPPPGFHTVTVRLGRDDLLPFDNERTFTFEVQPRRNILAIADNPKDVRYWRGSHNVGPQEFDCTVTTPDKLPDLGPFEMVAVIAVADPSPFATKLQDYVTAGGKLLLAPDGPGSDTDTNRPTAYETLGDLMPAGLGEIKTLARPELKVFGRSWRVADEADLGHPLFAPVRDWQKRGDIDIFKSPRITAKYRTLAKKPPSVVVPYADPDAAEPIPAVVERSYGKGQVLMLTTRIDDTAGDPQNFWNNFWTRDHSWPAVFPWLLAKYLTDLGTDTPAGDAGGKWRYNFPTGSEVPVPVRGFVSPGERQLRLEGPGVSADKSAFTLPADVPALTLRNKPPSDAPRGVVGPDVWELEGEPLLTPGAFALRPDRRESPWRFRFSLAVPPGESDLQKVPAETVAEVFGPDRVIRLDQQVALRDYIEAKLTRPFELFPALVLLVLVFFAVEGVLANRFYKLK